MAASELNTCPVNELEGESGKPIYKIVEEFADDHDAWARSFLDAWERMQATGYNDLKSAPQNSWLGYHTLIHTLHATIGKGFCTLFCSLPLDRKERGIVFILFCVYSYLHTYR